MDKTEQGGQQSNATCGLNVSRRSVERLMTATSKRASAGGPRWASPTMIWQISLTSNSSMRSATTCMHQMLTAAGAKLGDPPVTNVLNMQGWDRRAMQICGAAQ